MKSKSILLVDDNTDSRELIKTILECKGYEVNCTDDLNNDFEEKIIKNKPDAIIIDFTMPEIKINKIIDILDKLKIPLLALVGMELHYREMLKNVYNKIKTVEYIEKPFNPNFLIEKLNKLLKNTE